MEDIFNPIFETFGDFAIIIIVLKILVFIMPLIIAVDVNRMRYENKELKNELSEIKNLLILQNELLRNQRPPYNQ